MTDLKFDEAYKKGKPAYILERIRADIGNTSGQCKLGQVKKQFFAERMLWELSATLKIV